MIAQHFVAINMTIKYCLPPSHEISNIIIALLQYHKMIHKHFITLIDVNDYMYKIYLVRRMQNVIMWQIVNNDTKIRRPKSMASAKSLLIESVTQLLRIYLAWAVVYLEAECSLLHFALQTLLQLVLVSFRHAAARQEQPGLYLGSRLRHLSSTIKLFM